MTAAAVVPFFLDAETRAGIPDSAFLARRLARWQRWCRERMTGQTPCGARRTGAQALSEVPQKWCSAYVPAPPTPSRVLRIWWNEANNASEGDIGIRSRRTGTTQWLNVAPVYNKRKTGTVVVDAPDTLDVMIRWKSPGNPGSSYYPEAIGAWWEPLTSALVPGATFEPWSAISQSFYAAGRADSAHALRWLARRANQIASDRQRPVFSFGQGTSGMNALSFFRVAPGVPSVTVWVYCKGTASSVASATLYDPATNTQLATGSVPVPGDATWAWRSFSIAMGYATSKVFYASVVAGANVQIASVSVEEAPLTAAALGLPPGETVPAAFVDLDDPSLLGGTPLLADAAYGGSRARGRKALVENMVWLAANKVRTVWVTSAFSPWPSYGGAFASAVYPANGNPLNWQTQDVIRFRATPDGWTKQLRIAGGVYSDVASTEQGIATAEDNGTIVGSTRVPTGAPTQFYVEEAASVASGADVTLRRILTNPPPQNESVDAFSDGLTIEELPMGTPTTAWP
jgi:hypothetical protein